MFMSQANVASAGSSIVSSEGPSSFISFQAVKKPKYLRVLSTTLRTLATLVNDT